MTGLNGVKRFMNSFGFLIMPFTALRSPTIAFTILVFSILFFKYSSKKEFGAFSGSSGVY